MASSVSSMIALYWAWACSVLLRPLFILLVALILWNLDTFIYKLKLTVEGVAYFLFCHDKSWKKPTDPKVFFDPVLADEARKATVERKTIIFVRHGESTWNETFNKGPHRSALVFAVGFVPNLIKALLYEFYLLVTGQMDSWFYDAPMSQYGLDQVEALHKFLSKGNSGTTEREKEMIAILRGDKSAPSSKLISSGLRRASSTVAEGLRGRLSRKPNDTITVVPALQEIARNPDTLIITPPRQHITASWIEKQSKLCDFQSIFDDRFDMSLHKGNKPINTNGLKRMNEFCKYVFTLDEDAIVCGGHSIWFRYFFRTFLPYDSNYAGKTRKVVNAGCIGFTLMKATTDRGVKYMIDPDSPVIAYGGFS